MTNFTDGVNMINVLEMLEGSAEKYGDKTAFVDSGMRVTYADAVDLAGKIGSALAADGMLRRAVAVLIPKGVKELVSFFGIVYSGNFYVPIDTEMPVERMLLIFETLNPIGIIVDETTSDMDLGRYNDLKRSYGELVSRGKNQVLLEKIRKSAIDTDPVYALFTSGSTGVPKGVIVCHRSIIDYAGWCVATFDLSAETVFGNQTPFYFSMSVLDIYATICSGAALFIIPKVMFTFPMDLLTFLNKNKVNTIYWVPSALCMITKFNMLSAVELPFLQKILFAGEVMPTKHLNLWRKYLPDALYANLFGPTEITDIGIYYIVDREFQDDEPVPIGRACRNVDVFVLDDENKPVTEPGTVGELYYRGSYLAHGYYNNWNKTDEAYVQNPLNTAYPEIVYKSGDLVQWNRFGELVYVSRKDFQIKHMGYRIELGEIENVAGAFAEVDRCAAVYDSQKDDIVLFYEGKKCEEEKLWKFVKNRLPIYMVPQKLQKTARLPLNENGKIDRKDLQARLPL